MTCIDTNILIRLATFDDPGAAKKIASFISQKAKDSMIVSEGVIDETCYVLEFHEYKMNRYDIYCFLREVFAMSQVKSDKVLESAIDLYGKHDKLDFVDCLLLHNSSTHEIYTFDKKLLKAIDVRK